MDRIWERIEELVAGADPGGLADPASPEALDAVGVPAAWRGLWGRHDGQTDAVGNLFLDHWFLPLRGRSDSVEAEAPGLPDGYVPIAKDFAGGYLVLDAATGLVQELLTDGETVVVAGSPEELLGKVLEALRKHPPRRWVVGENGRKVPEGWRTVTVSDLANWAVGEARDLPGGLVAVRVRSPDPAPFAQHGSRLDFTLDHPDDPDAAGQLRGAKVVIPTGPEGTGTDASASVVTQGGAYWLEATGPVPHTAVLHLDVDFAAPVGGARPLLRARGKEPSVARARARLWLGDAGGALADLEQIADRELDALSRAEHAALAVECALAAGEDAAAVRFAERLAPGHRGRLLVWAERDPARAKGDADAAVAHRPTDGPARVWRADILERLGDFAAAAADTEEAISLLALSSPEQLPGLRAALRRRRARIAAPRTEAPVLEDSTEDFVIGNVVAVESVGAEWAATVHVTPREAAAGRLVEFLFPDGDRGAVRLPRGAGNGVRTTVHVGAAGQPVRVVIVVELEPTWRSAGDNATLDFDRWDVLAPVPSWKPRVRISGLDGEQYQVDWPEGDVEATVAGAGLSRADGTRGRMRVHVAR